jgi:hypothetical protein
MGSLPTPGSSGQKTEVARSLELGPNAARLLPRFREAFNNKLTKLDLGS